MMSAVTTAEFEKMDLDEMQKKQIDLRGMSREELTDFLEEVMIRLRQLDCEDIRKEFVTKSQRLRLEPVK
ncbi:MAG: hypothetical protein LV480_10640 [Methylacidiphilales bacterium]|nr:hypothetical protein [Candidatus Methylacidiphilales bacterium]